jgi:hypothetical protein
MCSASSVSADASAEAAIATRDQRPERSSAFASASVTVTIRSSGIRNERPSIVVRVETSLGARMMIVAASFLRSSLIRSTSCLENSMIPVKSFPTMSSVNAHTIASMRSGESRDPAAKVHS